MKKSHASPMHKSHKSEHDEHFTHNHGAMHKEGHHGLQKHSAKGAKGGNFMVSASNVKALGSKGKG